MPDAGPERGRGAPIPAFEAVGIELEYAIVARATLDVLPIADRLLAHAHASSHAGSGESDRSSAGRSGGRVGNSDSNGGSGDGRSGEVSGNGNGNGKNSGRAGSRSSAGMRGELQRGIYGWSNELVLHVIEVKNLAPAPSLSGLAAGFSTELALIDRLLAQHDARLLPGAMHPWMKPASETFLWPHENAVLYRHFDRIFDCARHGWANLQSMHINLPFAGDAEFARLHAAIRLALPIIPALAASSPFADGDDTGHADYRLAAYRDNAALLPAITGLVIPESVTTRAAYEAAVLAPMYRAIAPYDPAGLLQHEWLNSRGAIARFERDAIEIRLCDCQECPLADIAIAAAVIALVRSLYAQRTSTLAAQQAMPTAGLAALLGACIDDGEAANLRGTAAAAYLPLLGYPANACSARDLWRFLIDELPPEPGMTVDDMAPLRHILRQGTLATRLRTAVGDDLRRPHLQQVYGDLADCLRSGRLFDAGCVD